MRRKKRPNPVFWLLLLPMAVVALLFVLLPLVYVLVLSLGEPTVQGFVPGAFTFNNYLKMFNPMYFKVLLTSLQLAVTTTLLTMLIGYPFGYFMAKASPRWRGILMLLVMVPFWTNALVRLYAWRTILQANGPINTLLMALGIIETPLQLLFTYGAVLLGMIYALLPFMILPSYSSVQKMDWSFVEAARDLGAGRARAFLTVTLPLTLPGIMAGCVLVFVPSMGLYFISDIMSGGQIVLMGNLIHDQLLKARDWGFGSALSMLLLIVTALILLLYRKAGGRDLGVF